MVSINFGGSPFCQRFVTSCGTNMIGFALQTLPSTNFGGPPENDAFAPIPPDSLIHAFTTKDGSCKLREEALESGFLVTFAHAKEIRDSIVCRSPASATKHLIRDLANPLQNREVLETTT